MVTITLINENNEKKEFKKSRFTLQDKIDATIFNIQATKYFAKSEHTVEDYLEHEIRFSEMIAKIFGNKFTGEELRTQIDISCEGELQDIYLRALGVDPDKKEEEPEQPEKKQKSSSK